MHQNEYLLSKALRIDQLNLHVENRISYTFFGFRIDLGQDVEATEMVNIKDQTAYFVASDLEQYRLQEQLQINIPLLCIYYHYVFADVPRAIKMLL